MSLSFNGTSAKLLGTGLSSGVSGGTYTLFAWVKPSGTQNQGCVLEMKGTHGTGLQIDDQWGSGNGGWLDNGDFWYADRVIDSANWQPLMFTVTDGTHRKAYYKGVATPYTDVAGPEIASATSICIGARAGNNFWYTGLIAEVAYWSGVLTDADFTALAAGAPPSSVQPGSLIDYWKLQTQAATQVGVNGRTLTASNTSQGATHPPVVGSLLGGNVTLDDAAPTGTLTGGSPSGLAGNVTLDDAAPGGSGFAAGGAITGNVTLDDAAPGGSGFSAALGTVLVPALTNWNGGLQAGITIPHITVLRLSDRVQVLSLVNQVTNGTTGDLSLSSVQLTAGTAYMVVGWNADGSARFARPATAT